MSFTSLLIWGVIVAAGPETVPEWSHVFVRGLGLSGGLGICILMSRLNILGFINIWGKLSLQIYVSHVIFASGFRILLQRFLAVENPTIHIIASIIVGIAGPLLLYWFTQQIRFNYLYTWPKKSSPIIVTKPAV